MFSTIVHKNEDGTKEIYHGYLLEQYEDYFIFAFRIDCRNYIWRCEYDYWELLI